MSRALALLRPQPGWDASASAARAMGLEVTGHPLFDSIPVDWDIPQGKFDALLIGSAAVFRHGGPSLASLRHLPVYAVGEASASAARAAGFEVAGKGTGGLQDLVGLAGRGRLLRLMGEERVAIRPCAGQAIVERVVYRMLSHVISPDFAAVLTDRHPLVAVHSAAAARHFAAEADRLGVRRDTLALVALGPRIAEAAGSGWAAVHLPECPSDTALLAKAASLCK